ncbi:hypothetical protein [Methylobacter sp. S3L5C]|uniref:hypothetical protein n=1 Tax=Methylobacter sp. S3L5C TaxID=2839024 RepID=UPI001FAB4400|nr:hypothetical protein [Methylobacter sp. S3L5C]UOA07783.1 hypothetical protein KKZ03_16220 [Methylobacter sp. S3L5C]
MTALVVERNTKQRTGDIGEFPVKAAVKCLQGGLAVLSGGYAAPATTATGLIAIGRFEDTADNSAGGAGAIKARVGRGTFLFGNSASTDLIAQADVSSDCYLVDDQTVAKTSGTSTRSRAGKIVAVESAGVWVLLGLGV